VRTSGGLHLILGIAVISAVTASAQSPLPGSGLAFEVVSVKENRTAGESGLISGPTPGRFTVRNTPLRFILLYAFDLRSHQLIDTPEWASTAAFDITGTYPPGATPTVENNRVMLQALLADRFGLRMHRETRELPMYALVLARPDGRLGPQLTPSSVDCEKWLAEKRPQIGAGGPSAVAPGGARPACMMMTSRRFLTAGTRSIDQLTASLQSLVERPVVNRTGLTSNFDIDLQWTSPEAPPTQSRGGLPQEDVAALFTAVQEQLGLKLESSRGPFEVVVIDSVERPTPD
jgi:uncharacterized protein (TIGR03435 family)